MRPLDAGLREGARWSGYIDESTQGWCKVIKQLEPGQRLLSGAGRWLVVWDLIAGSIIETLEGHHSDLCAIAVSEDSRWLATGGEDFRVLLRRLDTFQVVGAALLHSTPRAIEFDLESQRLFVIDELQGYYAFSLPGC